MFVLYVKFDTINFDAELKKVILSNQINNRLELNYVLIKNMIAWYTFTFYYQQSNVLLLHTIQNKK